MQKYRIAAVMAVLVVAIGCSTYRLQPRPDGPGWFTCPHCQGYGTIASVGAPGGKGILGKNTREDMVLGRGIMDDMVYNGLASLDGDKKRMDDYDHGSIEKKSDQIQNDLDRRNFSGDSGEGMRYHVCPTCSGRGWVK